MIKFAQCSKIYGIITINLLRWGKRGGILQSKKFENTAILLFAVSILASALNYLFQILSGRLLSHEEFGTLNSVFSVINILTIFGTAFGLSIAKDIAKNDIVDDKIICIIKFFLYISVPVIAIIIGIMNIMKFTLPVCICSAVAIFLISFTYVFYGMLQGKKVFWALGIFTLVQPTCKVIFGTVFIKMGFGIISAPISMILGSIFCMIFGYKVFLKIRTDKHAGFSDIKHILNYTAYTLISMICITIFNNIDILIVRNYFTDYDAGIYSCSAMFGKIIMYIPSALTVLLVPVAAGNINEGRKALKKSLLYSFILSFLAGTGLFILKKPIISIIMGKDYLPSGKYILPLCFAVIPLVLSTVLINYLIATGDKFFVSFSGLSALAVMLITVQFIHTTIITVLLILAVIYSVLTIVLFIRSQKVCQKDV